VIVSENLLFSGQHLSEVLRGHLASAQQEVDKISKKHFQTNEDDQIVEHVYSKMEITPLAAHPGSAEITEPRETRFQRPGILEEVIYVKGVELDYSLPYTGESDLWKHRPSTYSLNPPRGSVIPDRTNDQVGILQMKLVYGDGDFKPENVNAEIERANQSISDCLVTVERDIVAHNQQLRTEISRLVKQRRERVGGIQATMAALEIPVQRREGAPEIGKLPIRKKTIPRLAARQKADPEYGISDETYEQILKVIRHEGATFERTPSTYTVHNEEELRDIMLAHLNGHFEGQASGETFRKNGKTDIAIEFENRAAFVAECKVWGGDKKVGEALDQLLGYLTWRDVKTALVIFNKDIAGFKGIQEKLPGMLESHPNFVSIEPSGGGEWQLRIRSGNDEERIIKVQVFLFNLYVMN